MLYEMPFSLLFIPGAFKEQVVKRKLIHFSSHEIFPSINRFQYFFFHSDGYILTVPILLGALKFLHSLVRYVFFLILVATYFHVNGSTVFFKKCMKLCRIFVHSSSPLNYQWACHTFLFLSVLVWKPWRPTKVTNRFHWCLKEVGMGFGSLLWPLIKPWQLINDWSAIDFFSVRRRHPENNRRRSVRL
jgi:hypothetical protein